MDVKIYTKSGVSCFQRTFIVSVFNHCTSFYRFNGKHLLSKAYLFRIPISIES